MRHMLRSLDERTRIWRIVILCCVANLINAADRVIMPIAIIPIADHFGWDLHQYGWILSTFSVGYLSSMIIGGSAAKRYGGSRVLVVAVLLWSVSTLITPPFAFSIKALITLRFLLGVGEGIGLPTIMHILSLLVPVNERSRALGYLMAFGSIGQIVATLICPHLDWKLSFYLFGTFGLIWLACWLCIVREVRCREQTAEEYFTLQTRASQEDTNQKRTQGPTPVDELGPSCKQTPHWYAFLIHWPLWAIYIAHFSMNWSSYIVMQWLPTYLARYLGAGKNEIMFTALPYLSNSIGSIVAGHIADTFIQRHWSVIAVRRLMTCIGLFGPGLLLFAFSASTSITVAIFTISLSMLLSAFNSAGHLSNHAEVAPNHAAITFAISNTLATIPGILCGPMTAALVVQSDGRWFPVFLVAGCVNLLGAVVYVSQSSSLQVL
ncbi:unnamed protein product [Calicophoron daubneyi]|uniref:Major facilitator superfamily (MFS) profile domain-containing protein n=1 Tax=Calicophoron daubneyi TaxID=300641 RepID=A0AAV2TR87_CALDB